MPAAVPAGLSLPTGLFGTCCVPGPEDTHVNNQPGTPIPKEVTFLPGKCWTPLCRTACQRWVMGGRQGPQGLRGRQKALVQFVWRGAAVCPTVIIQEGFWEEDPLPASCRPQGGRRPLALCADEVLKESWRRAETDPEHSAGGDAGLMVERGARNSWGRPGMSGEIPTDTA